MRLVFIQDMLKRGNRFQADVESYLQLDQLESSRLQTLYDTGYSLDLDIPELSRLEQVLLQTKWVEEVSSLCLYAARTLPVTACSRPCTGPPCIYHRQGKLRL